MKSQALVYQGAGRRFVAELYWPQTAMQTAPGVLVFPDAFGLAEHARERARALAALGYVALAADLHGEGAVYADVASMREHLQPLLANRVDWRARAQAALAALLAQPQVDGQRVAAIGFCFGGATCLELARCGAPLKAIVGFHAGVLAPLPGDEGRISAKVLLCQGADDPLLKPENTTAVEEELRRDRVDWQLIRYGNTVHSFTHRDAATRQSPAMAYNADSDRRAWAAMCGLLAEVF